MKILHKQRTLCHRALCATGFWDRFSGLQMRFHWPGTYDGILFPRCRAVHTYFTFLRPDILFLDPRGRILAVHPCVHSWLILTGPRGSKETLEIPSGTIRRMRLKVGAFLKKA